MLAGIICGFACTLNGYRHHVAYHATTPPIFRRFAGIARAHPWVASWVDVSRAITSTCRPHRHQIRYSFKKHESFVRDDFNINAVGSAYEVNHADGRPVHIYECYSELVPTYTTMICTRDVCQPEHHERNGHKYCW